MDEWINSSHFYYLKNIHTITMMDDNQNLRLTTKKKEKKKKNIFWGDI